MAGAFGVGLSIAFDVQAYLPASFPFPIVRLDSSPVFIDRPVPRLVGYASPEVSSPFRICGSSVQSGTIYRLQLSASQVEAIEGLRDGNGLLLRLVVRAATSRGDDVQNHSEDVRIDIAQSEWLRVLEEAQYQRTLVVEVPLVDLDGGAGSSPVDELKKAQRLLWLGHFQDSVAACRRVLEAIEIRFGLENERKEAFAATKQRDLAEQLTLFQRELLLRHSAMRFAHVASHADGTAERPFDRTDATLMLAVTAAIARAAFARATGDGDGR